MTDMITKILRLCATATSTTSKIKAERPGPERIAHLCFYVAHAPSVGG